MIYSIADKKYTRTQLTNFAKEKKTDPSITDWQKAIFQFMLEWFDEKEYIIAQTSGSTGKPKSIQLSKAKMAQSAQMTARYFDLKAKSKVALLLPSHYIAGKMMIVRALTNGWDLYYASPKGNVLQDLPDLEFDFTALVPLQVENSLQTPEHWRKIKKCLLGGAPVSEILKEKLKKLPTLFYESYGMTETMSHVAIKDLGTEKNTFEALPEVSFEKDERDCLKIIAPALLETPLQTNDVVDLIDSKHFRWLGRFDHVINSGGVKLIPEQIEAKLKPHLPFDFFIIGEKDEKLGAKVVLVVEASENDLTQIAFESIFNQCLDQYEKPKSIYLSPQFARTKSGKVLRKESMQGAQQINLK